MYLGIDFGGSHIKYGLVQDKRLLAAEQLPLAGMSFAELLICTAEGVHRLLHEARVPLSDLRGVAIAVPGVVDSERSELLSLPEGKYPGALGFDFAAWSLQSFGCRAELFNDAILALLGEVYAGAGQGCGDAALVIIGTGIGTAVMMNGRLLKSRNHVAGNLGGHLMAHAGGEPCSCGSRGCVEAYASNSTLHRTVHRQWDLNDSPLGEVARIDYRAVFDRFEQDKTARQIGQQLITYWAHVVINMLHAYDSEVVILSGSVFNAEVNILERIEQYVKQHVWLPQGSFRLKVAADPTNSVLLGAECKRVDYYR